MSDSIDHAVFENIKARMNAKFPILLEGFLRDAKAYMTTIEMNIPDGDIHLAIEAAHSLKSSSGLLGLVQVSKNAEALEAKAKTMQAEGKLALHDLRPNLDELQNSFSEIEGNLQNELEKARLQ